VKYPIEERTAWRWWVTPKPLVDKPIHNWLIFPHSFTSELVYALIEEWGLGPNDLILDPFVGAGTTLLAAKEKGIPAKGYDLSPMAVLTTKVKIFNYNISRLEAAWSEIEKVLISARWDGVSKDYPKLVKKALPGKLLGAFDALAKTIDDLPYSKAERDFFRLALLSIIPQFSRAVATGGWLKWVDKKNGIRHFPKALDRQVLKMLNDIQKSRLPRKAQWQVQQADARSLPVSPGTYSAVITSPPYPNRHDYTRVFGIELMFGFMDWKQTRQLRYQSFHSHPEARPQRPESNGYTPPRSLIKLVEKIHQNSNDPRIPKMLEGYFLDMYLCLREIKRVCKPKANIAFVVGNAQYNGEPLMVDELTAEIGEQAGLTYDRLLVARYRGNSAQQMGKYGRSPSRESVVIFEYS